MKFFNFHLMPYRHADLVAIAANGSAWVTFSNSHYDPQKGAELYHEYLDQLELADQLGFDGVCLNEHHQNAYGLMPIPGVLAGALARSVKRGKIAILGRALPLVDNPLTIAEEYAMLDNLTRGRFIAGFVRGIGAEYHSSGVNPAFSQARFLEAHDLILRAWIEPGPFTYSGTIYVADTDAKAVREARPHLEALVNYFLKMPIEMLLPPGYTDPASIKRVRNVKVTGTTQSIEDLIASGVVIVGGPETVREKLAAYQDLAGFNTVLTKTQFGTLPDEMARANMIAIAEEIIPHFRQRLPERAPKAAAE